MKTKIYFVIFTLGLLSCKDGNPTSKKTYNSPEITDTLTYDFGYAVNFMHCGVFEENGKEYFFFSNLNTAQKITILDEDFKIVQEINLKSEELRSYDLQDVQVINSDSILLFANYKYLFAIDSSVKITGKCDLSEIKTEDGLYPYSFGTSVSGPFGLENSILVSSFLDADEISQTTDLSQWDFWEKINNLNFDYDQMLFIENPFDKKKNVNRIKYHQSQIKKDHYYNGLFYAYQVSNDIVLSSHFYNFVLRYNIEKKILDSIPIKSQFTKIGTNSPSYKAVRADSKKADWNKYYRGTPKIYRMFLNKYNGDISVFVDLPYEEKDIGTDKPKWIWQCYDKDFNLITERQILHTDWGFGAVFNSAKGIMMMDNNYQNPNKPFERKMFVFK
jgi:hypothetical protein